MNSIEDFSRPLPWRNEYALNIITPRGATIHAVLVSPRRLVRQSDYDRAETLTRKALPDMNLPFTAVRILRGTPDACPSDIIIHLP